MGVVRPASARLPDAFVRLVPMAADVFAEGAQHALGLPVERASLPHEVGHGIDHLAVHVQLELVGRRVADPDRPRSPISGQPVEDAFGRRLVAVQVVEDVELGPGQPGGLQQPLEEGVGLVGKAEPVECPDRERRVAQPAEPVIPVERAADSLGQGRGRRGDDRTRGSVDQELEGERAPDHRLPPGAVVANPRGPVSPPVDRSARLPRATTRPMAAAPPAHRPRG